MEGIAALFGGILYIAFIALGIWFSWIAFGKSVERYGVPMLKAMRSLAARIIKSLEIARKNV